MTSSPRPITKWSVLALAAIVCGLGLTLGLDQVWLAGWAQSGKGFPVGQRASIDLPPGDTLVWYESPYSVPAGDVTMDLRDADGERVKPGKPEGDESYGLLFGGKSGRALWKLSIPRAGRYEFQCNNHNFESDGLVPAQDRIVFLKTPDSLSEVTLVRKLIQITGATISVTLVIVFYILHGLALQRRHAVASSPVSVSDAI